MRPEDMWSWLDAKGIRRDEVLAAALELYVPHPGVETREKAEEVLGSILDKALQDPNVNSLVVAGFLLEEEGRRGSIPGLPREAFDKDPVLLVADEVLGMAIAEYIGGTRARFEYVRYDKKKPGILGRLGPFLDDTVCGLIAGATSRMYTGAE